MAPSDYLTPLEAQRLAKRILASGGRVATVHAKKRGLERDITMVDVENVIRGGRVLEAGRMEQNTYRYRMETPRFCVVFAFRSDTELAIVTSWRKKR